MKFSAPKITIDRQALKTGIWGNTWRNWGYILAGFLCLYAIEAGYFTGLLFAAKEIRGQSSYKTLTSQYFGKFDRQDIPIPFPYPKANSENPFNRPQNCMEITQQETIAAIDATIDRPTGVQKCTSTNDNTGWVLFPWVADTNAAGNFPACAGAEGATLITSASPAYITPEGENPVDAPIEATCQNFVIYEQKGGVAAPAPGPSDR